MEFTLAYAIAVGGTFVLLILWNLRYHIRQFLEALSLITSKHLIYRQLLHRHRYIGPWSPADVLLQSIYIAANVCCLRFWETSLRLAGLQAANLSLINLIPLFTGPYLSFLADLLGISLSAFRRLHRSAAIMSFVLLLFHVIVVLASQTSFSLDMPHKWGITGGSSLCFILLLSHPLLRKPSYEIFLRTHQALAVLSAFAIWQHLASKPLLPRLYIYVFVGIFLSTFLFQCGLIIYRNRAAGGFYPQASISHVNDIIKIHLNLPRKLKLKTGQYIGLYIPAVSFWSLHPFVVISWSEGEQSSLDLFIEPRRGFTQELLRYSKAKAKTETETEAGTFLALFSGPHGISAPVGKYETVLMVASGFGIAAQLPYLRQLIYGYNACKTRTRRVHLVWQLETIDIGIAAESLLNDALVDDTLDEGYILSISIYIKSGRVDRVPFGRRAIVDTGSADLASILQEEVTGKYIKRVQGETGKPGEILVIVSGTDWLRDQLRDLVRGYVDDKVGLFELEFQPA